MTSSLNWEVADLLRNEALFLPEGFIAVIITSWIVSLCTTVCISRIRCDEIVDTVKIRMSEYEDEIFRQWEGCRQCTQEDMDM